MTSRPETIAQLRRKIERLEAQVESLKELSAHTFKNYAAYMGQFVDLDIRIKQAMRILSGEDEL